jgi:hypothetical protein
MFFHFRRVVEPKWLRPLLNSHMFAVAKEGFIFAHLTLLQNVGELTPML